MDNDNRLAYQKEIGKRLKTKYESNRVKILLGIISVFIGESLLYLIYRFTKGESFALEFLWQEILYIISINLVGFIVTYIYVAWHKVPEEIFLEQKKIIEEYLPEKLSLNIERVPGNLIISGKNRIRCVAVQITSLESKKITELQAVINFEHFYYEHDRRTVNQQGFHTNELLLWQDSTAPKKEIELRPGKLKILIISEILNLKSKGSKKMPAAIMASDPVGLSPYFCEESIYKIHVLFQGKLEGEYKYKALHYEDIFYAKPSDQRILFLDDAEKSYLDIPPKLLSRSKEVLERMGRHRKP